MPPLNGFNIELIMPPGPRRPPRVALFDFDGTLSLVRAGWEDVMIPMMVSALRQAPQAEGDDALTALVTEFVRALTGQQTIVQFNRLAQEFARRGGSLDPEAFKAEYVARLAVQVDGRRAALAAGTLTTAQLRVPGALEFVEALRARGVICYLASGTDEPFVKAEAALLEFDPHMTRIWGALPGQGQPIKLAAVVHIVREHSLAPGEWISCGDGPAEIEYARSAGGVAVGVATDEAARGPVNAWKRDRLIAAGAQLIVPDFSAHAALARYLFAEDQ
ncbi:MAG TPA: haloacid dehalogenase-like hydrolase [Candidatus Acidoferrales bacterium]